MKWRRCYSAISGYVRQLNQFFGPTLLLFLAKQFINLVTFVFVFIVEIQKQKWSSNGIYALLYLVKNCIYITVLAFLSDQIDKQVSISLNSTLLIRINLIKSPF